MTDTVVAEGQIKFRDGKKWKTRWVVLRKPSPVADRKKTKDKERSHYHKERLNVKIEAICGVEPGPGYDGVSYSLSILCQAYNVALGFHSREALAAWEDRIRYSLGEVHRFSVQVQPGTKLESGPASLHLCNTLLVLTRDVPPIVIGQWKLPELRRYGAVPDGFVFEGGSRCGQWAGVFYLSSAEGEQISFHLDCIARGVSPSRVSPRGPRPPLPEEQINLEALELEKRLSMLSHCSRPCSTASTYSCSTVAGDDHSSISSSSSSQSDSSFGSRLLVWAEPTSTRSRLSNEMISSSSTLKALLTGSDSVLFNTTVAGAATTCPSSNQVAAHGLHDSGRQNSLDSGIGIASSSQSSGSFSSYTGSLDAASQAGGEDFGSLASLPVASSRPTSPLHALFPPYSLPPRPTSPLCMLGNRQSSASPAPVSRSSTADSGAFPRPGDAYQVPGLLRPCYDTPRSLLLGVSLLRDIRAQGGPPALGRDRRGGGGGGPGRGPSDSPAELSLLWAQAQPQATGSHSHSWGGERAPPVYSAGRCTARVAPQCSHTLDNYIIPDQWRSAGGRHLTQRRLCSASNANYINVPMSPAVAQTRRELLSMELHLKDPSSPVLRPLRAVRGDSLRYTHLDMAAMETVQKVSAGVVAHRQDEETRHRLLGNRRGAHT
ncbi:hypothetical protein NHX12_018176 [Muraenolepis orangiensis]|uniref:Protein Dok-7 n=1 Tax=Muraenolepis orangiensis TaxID=630683 RepID=A0A9Q0IXT2_9TELE|nr:hypothetical protein NHX12_018176 [Muraenolepis orangiensis]